MSARFKFRSGLKLVLNRIAPCRNDFDGGRNSLAGSVTIISDACRAVTVAQAQAVRSHGRPGPPAGPGTHWQAGRRLRGPDRAAQRSRSSLVVVSVPVICPHSGQIEPYQPWLTAGSSFVCQFTLGQLRRWWPGMMFPNSRGNQSYGREQDLQVSLRPSESA